MYGNHALDGRTKRRLKSLVLELRHALEEDLIRQLRRLGIDSRGGAPKPLEKLAYLDDREVAARRVVDALMEKERRVTPDQRSVIASIVREGAYTHLNRLVGLKSMEARGLLRVDGEITEVVTARPEYGGRPKLLWVMREADSRYRHGPEAEERLWREGLERACVAVTREIGVLFDPEDPYAQVWPSFATLRRVVEALNELPQDVFLADETLGWLYQYFQSEEKDRVFEEVKTKRCKVQWHDLIPATSLYTERYMVEFLLQNSLGALWMEMHPESGLHASWPYYVPPATPRRRDPRPVKEWRVLDPACGSGHFLVVAFDLLRQLHEEERRLAETGRVSRDWPVPEDRVAATILAENLHGIDIDPRSVQISALALWLKAREAGLAEPPTLNLVIADCVLGRGTAYEQLLSRYKDPPDVQNAIRSIWDSLEHIRDLGSLIRVEEELRMAMEGMVGKPKKTPWLWQPQEGWSAYREQLLDDLSRAFVLEADGDDLGERLFGAEAKKGLDFVATVSRRYDVVCTNPPYMGSKNMGRVLKEFVAKHYGPGKRDLYAAFILRCRELAKEGGYVAMVTQQSWMFIRSYGMLRALEDSKLDQASAGEFKGLLRETSLGVLAHLGEFGFQDPGAAGAFAVMFTLRNASPPPGHRLTAFRLVGPKSPGEKDALLREAVASLRRGAGVEVGQ
jgi:hypothetical protein